MSSMILSGPVRRIVIRRDRRHERSLLKQRLSQHLPALRKSVTGLKIYLPKDKERSASLIELSEPSRTLDELIL